ncbi:MAG: GerMN domain-containing protein [bacterium]|nr:GerMN domain-containing protein [bacterium]
MTRNILIGFVVVIVLVAGGWWYFNQSSAPATSEATQLPITQQAIQQQPTSNSAQTAPTNPGATTPPAKTYAYENSGNLKSFASPSGTHAVMYDAQAQGTFRIVETSTKKVLSDYRPKTGSSIICEMVCYPFAEWLGNTTLVIGSYSLVNNTWSSANPAKRHEVFVFDVSTESDRPATQSEIMQFDLYNDANLSWESIGTSVTLYHYTGTSGNEYQSVVRSVSPTPQITDAALKLLFQVYLPTLTSEYTGVSLVNGAATVNFKQGAHAYLDQAPAGISAEYTNSIRQTLLQFNTIKKVYFSIDGQVITEWDA